MGYEVEILRKLVNTAYAVFSDVSGVRMLEFGNQEVYGSTALNRVKTFYREKGYAGNTHILKYFFQHLGFRHTSIDYNGKDGALPYDVREPLSAKFPVKFQLITNIGFSEHVGENTDYRDMMAAQYAFFKNIHELGGIDSLYYHCVPLTHNWYKHGVCDYSLEFFAKLCEVCNYKIMEGPFVETYHPEKQASVFYTKTMNNDFITFAEFSTLPGLRSTAHD